MTTNTDPVRALLAPKLDMIISGYRINQDDADWLRGLLHRASAPPSAGEVPPEDRFEQFVQAEIARSPNALRELGCYLADVLDEDRFPRANRLLLQLATEYAPPSAPVGVDEMQRRLDREESDHARTIDQRDAAEDALGRMFQAVTGRPAEWSSAWDYAGAIEEVEEHVAALAQQPAVRTLAKHQPCGCVICTCEDEQQCQGCGAKHCGNRADHPPYVGQQPAAPSGEAVGDWVLVPRKVTTAMANAAWRDLESQGIDPEDVETPQIWDAMLAAAPQQPAAVDEVRIPAVLAERVQAALGRFISDEGWGMEDMQAADDFAGALAAQQQEVPRG